MADRPEPYVPKDPGDIIRSGDWNELQVRAREEIHVHQHTGEEDGAQLPRAGVQEKAIDGSRIDPESTVTLKTLKVTDSVQEDLKVTGTVNAENFIGNGIVPKGVIVMWSGKEDEIPPGWMLCDGQNGTPDLRGRFIVGAGTYENGIYTFSGDKGEPDSHIHGINIPSLAVITDKQGSHQHALTKGSVKGGTHSTFTFADERPTDYAGEHQHNLIIKYPSLHSEPDSGSNRPRWYALCFIMKL